MSIEFNLSNIIFTLIALLSGFWALAKVIVIQNQNHMDTKFSALSVTISKDQEVTRQLERDLLLFKSELPRTYLRRDDYVREVQVLQEAMQRDILPIRQSLTRIEDFLMQK